MTPDKVLNDFFDKFPDRKSLVSEKEYNKENFDNYREHLKKYIETEVDKLDINNVNFNGTDFAPRTEITQKTKVFVWVRVFLKEEIDINPETDVKFNHILSGEEFLTKFICYAKKGSQKNSDGIVEYNPEEDKKILCIMVDEELLKGVESHKNKNLASLFRTSIHYVPQIFSVDMLKLTYDGDKQIEYHSIAF